MSINIISVIVWYTAFILTYRCALDYFVPKTYLDRYKFYAGSRTEKVAGFLFSLIWLVSALDCMPITFWRIAIGFFFIIGGLALVIWTRRSNPYFVPTLIRPYRLVKAGPYEYFPHPGYLGYILMGIGPPVLFSSSWAIVALAGYTYLIITRIVKEEEFLSQCFQQSSDHL